jgi:hypothetical protein
MFKQSRTKLFVFTLAIAGAQAGLPSAKVKPAKVSGKWRIAWDVRLGTVRGILD